MVKKTAASDDANLHRQMLEQLGLKPDSKEGQLMIKELKTKLTGKKKKQQLESDNDEGWQNAEDDRLRSQLKWMMEG